MAQILDKQGLQHYANKMCNADNRKVGSKNLPTALNDIDTAIDGFKTLFETEYGTPVNMELENNENVFSIGTGINIDKKDDVENSFTDVELSGNSLVNCVLIDKLYEDSNYLEFENSPVITEGNITLKSRKLNHVRFCPKIECGVIKPNTKYTLIFNVTSNNLTGRTNLTHTNTDTLISAFPFTNTIQPKQKGIFKYVLTSKEDIGSCNTLLRTIIWDDCSTEGETITFSLMILEGDWTNKPIPQYFEGLKSIGENQNNKIDILSCNGGNIISNPRYKRGYYVDYRNGNEKEGVIYSCTDYIEIEPNRKIRVVNANLNIAFYDSNKNYIKRTLKDFIGGDTNFKTITPSNASYVRFSTPNEAIGTEGCFYGDSIGDINTEIRIDKKEISLNEPLRGLPNGIKDTIEKINGEWKIVRKVGSIVLNGSEQWKEQVDGSTEEFLDIRCGYSTLLNRNKQNGLCDKFNYITKGSPIGEQEGIQLYTHATQSQFIASMSKSRFSTVDSFKEYLAQNHTTVLYELVTPIIEDISPITLQCWKNGTISIGEVLPVETTHTVALNKSAQIQKNIEELTLLRNRVEALEKQYNNSTLNQAYELELLRLDMQLDNII